MTHSASDGTQAPDDEFGLSAVREILRLIRETDITELKIERGDIKLHIKRGATPTQAYMVTPSLAESLPHHAGGALPPVAPFPPHGHSQPAHSDQASDSRFAPNAQVLTSPMVGTYYASPSPKDAPFVREGDEVRSGEVVGIVEAMKIMNEIESEFAGRVVRILVTTGQPVEYGQPLMVIEPV